MRCPGCGEPDAIAAVTTADGRRYDFPCLACGRVGRRTAPGGHSYGVVRECRTPGCHGSTTRVYDYGPSGVWERSYREPCEQCYGGPRREEQFATRTPGRR